MWDVFNKSNSDTGQTIFYQKVVHTVQHTVTTCKVTEEIRNDEICSMFGSCQISGITSVGWADGCKGAVELDWDGFAFPLVFRIDLMANIGHRGDTHSLMSVISSFRLPPFVDMTKKREWPNTQGNSGKHETLYLSQTSAG